MTEIISVRFKAGGKQYYFAPGTLTVHPGMGVILDTSRGPEYGECVLGNTLVEDETVVQPLRPVLRLADEKDMETLQEQRQAEARAFSICQQRIAARGLDMKLISAEYSFDSNKILFCFTAENRVDFRALVKDLASTLHARIELRQIGVRDEARKLGGLGICGKPFCCATFLDDFQPVSIKMAKTQNLSLNPTKISGSCGRLMCCLKYEQDAYEDILTRTPKPESFVETPDGVGTVSGVNLLREQVKVRLEEQPETPRCYHNCEICVVRSGRGKLPPDYTPPSPAQLEQLRKVTPPPASPFAAPAPPPPVTPPPVKREANRGRSGKPDAPAKPKGKPASGAKPAGAEKQAGHAPAVPREEPTGAVPASGEKRPQRNRRRPRGGRHSGKTPPNKPQEPS